MSTAPDASRFDTILMLTGALSKSAPYGALQRIGLVAYQQTTSPTGTNWVPVFDGTVATADDQVVATVTATGGVGGSATGSLAIQLNRKATPTTAIATAKRVLVTCRTTAAGSAPLAVSGVQGTVTFGNATVGSIVDSGPGWALILTSATGAFACDMTDADDETVNIWCESPSGVTGALTTDCDCSPVFDAATWAP